MSTKSPQRRQQIEDFAEAICSADSEREIDTRVSLKQCEDRVSVLECESRVPQEHEVHVNCETHVLLAPKHEASVLSVLECDDHVFNSIRDGRVSTQREVCVPTKKHETCV